MKPERREIKWVGFAGDQAGGNPNPATAEAKSMGCTCSPKVNKRGEGFMDGVEGPFWAHYLTCPLHGQKARLELARQFQIDFSEVAS